MDMVEWVHLLCSTRIILRCIFCIFKLLLHSVGSFITCRYLSHVMDVATPTDDCLALVHDLLLPVIMKSKSKGKSDLSHQEV
jgi:hypothetical protein